VAICDDAGLKGTKEPVNIYNGAVPSSRLQEFFNFKNNIRPDFAFHVLKRQEDILPTQMIYDVKNLFSFTKFYSNTDRGSATKKRERECKSTYAQHARDLDKKYNNTSRGSRGPIECRLDALGGIIPLCFGRFGEVNQPVRDLLEACSLAKARRVANKGSMNRSITPGEDEVVNIHYWKERFFNLYTRVLSTVVGYHKADVIITRKGFIGLSPKEQTKNAQDNYHPSIQKLFSGFKRDYYGLDQGRHFYDFSSR
jgi:hypothetical protein